MVCTLGGGYIIQDGPGTEPEPETETVGTVFPGTGGRTGTAGTVFQEPKPEPEPSLSDKPLLKHRETTSPQEPSEPKTRTAGTVPCTNRNRAEPNRGHPVYNSSMLQSTGIRWPFWRVRMQQSTRRKSSGSSWFNKGVARRTYWN